MNLRTRDVNAQTFEDSSGVRASTARLPVALGGLIVLVSIALGLLVAYGPSISSSILVIVLALPFGVVLGYTALHRFWWFILIIYLVRASLDALKSSGGGSGLEPGSAVGAVFLVAAAAWLFVQWRSGELAPISWAGKALLLLGLAHVISAPGAEVPFDSAQQAMKFVAIAVMYVVLEQIFFRHPERLKSALIAAFLSILGPAIVALSQVPNAHATTGPGGVDVGRIDGTFVHPNIFAAYLVILGLLSIALLPHIPRWRIGLLAVFLTATPLLLLTYARGAWFALYLGLLLIGFAQSRVLLGVLFVTTIIAVLFVPSVTSRLSDLDFTRPRSKSQVDANSAQWRVNYWIEILPYIKENPVTGIGSDMIRHESPLQAPAHNAYIDVIVETGIFGIVAMILAIVAVGVGLVRSSRRLVGGVPRGMAVGAIAIGVALVLQFFSESLLTQPAVLWYAVLPIAWVIAAGRRVELADPGRPTAGVGALLPG